MRKKKLHYYWVALTCFVFFFGKSLHGQDSSKVTLIPISGKITSVDSTQTLSFKFFKDFLSFEEIIYSASIQNDSFSLLIPIVENSPGFVVFNNQSLPIFLEKSDALYLTSVADFFVDSLVYKGKGALANTYLKQTFLHFDTKDAQRIEGARARNTAQGYQRFLEDYKQQKINFRDTFLAQLDTLFSESFTEYVEADINYWWGQNLLRYRVNHPASGVLPVALHLEDTYFSFVDSLALNNEKALNNLNYIEYLQEYTDWRMEQIARGKLQFNQTETTKKELIQVKMVETFGQVLIDDLEVRREAYDGLSAFAKLSKGSEVLYLQDITNDRFVYPYKGKRYRDKFLKVELLDGRSGWVFRGGINLKQQIVHTKKWVEIPDARPELMRHFKYANFQGKVMEYAIAKDLYEEIRKMNGVDNPLLLDFLDKCPASEYTQQLKIAYELMQKKESTVQSKIPDTLQMAIDSAVIKPLAAANLLQNITQSAASSLIHKSKSFPVDSVESSDAWFVPPPDFSRFTKITNLTTADNNVAVSGLKLLVNHNPMLREESSFDVTTAKSTPFRLDLPLRSTTTATLQLGGQRIDLLLMPEKELVIHLWGNDLYEHLHFSGKGSKVNNYLVAAAKKFKFVEKELEQQIQRATPTEFKQFLTKIKEEKLQFIRKYLETHTLTADAIKYAKADVFYWYAFNLMNYPYEHPIFHDQPAPMVVPADYYDFIKEVELNNSAALPNKYYLYYLQDYLSHMSQKTENDQLSKIELANKYLKGKPLYFYTAWQQSVALKRGNLPNVERTIVQFIEHCPYQLYEEYLKLAYHENRGIIEGMSAPEFQVADVNGNLVSLSDYKGKVVFLDFWATWCRPCTRLLPIHRQLQAQFEEDSVAFLYVSLDKNANNWRQFLSRTSFSGTHLFANENITKKYKVETLPYSLLIDANGKIVWYHTGGFSVQRVRAKIIELLQ
ncbi:MAG: TlpA disulfide reductase family protein [Bacteroidota bacterium]